ncbi:MAG: RNA-directed polymerase [Patescibacteria group bacterium]|nr:RNA-directed polymerase [Patescibacteria group bacterium]
MDNDINYQQWVEAQRNKICEWRRSNSKKKFVGERGYLHFDGKIFFRDHIDTGGHSINEILRSTDAIVRHRFLPFIRDDQRVRKFRDKKEITSLGCVRKHSQRFPTIKNRPIMFAAHRDACIYSFYGEILTRPYELILKNKKLDDAVLAYRKICNKTTGRNKSNIDLAQDFHKKIMSYDKVGILMADMSSFFDTIDHKRLADRWKETLGLDILPPDHTAILKSLTRYRYVFKREIYKALNLSDKKTKELSKSRLAALCGSKQFNQNIKKAGLIRQNRSGRGIPQGSPISGLLANIYMTIFDEKMHDYVVSRGGHYGRYSDDIVVLIDESLLFDTYEFMKTLIKDEGIKINNKKTDCFTFNKATGEFINALNVLGIDNPLNNKQRPQYLGFMYGSKDMFLRSATLARRFRGNNKLDKNRWNYFRLAQQKTHSKPMAKQIIKVRNKIKRKQDEQ